jgi:thiol-disulfide isomerase/thioredoxin
MKQTSDSVPLALAILVGAVFAIPVLAPAHESPVRDADRAANAGELALRQCPSLDGRLGEIPAERWIGAPNGGISGKDLRGSVVLVEFWTYLCYNCKNVEPWMKETHAKYSGQGLEVIGIHTPEFDVEKKFANVVEYVNENAIGYPIAIDNGFRVWRKYNKTNAWPAFLVYDRDGKLVYCRSGERAVHGAEQAIEKALAQPVAAATGGTRSHAAGSGVAVRAKAMRESASHGFLEVSFVPEPGFKLVKSPPAEITLSLEKGVSTAENPTLFGEPFAGFDSRDVRYWEGPATLRIPLKLSGSAAADAQVIRGSVVYNICDTRSKVCARQEMEFAERMERS